MECLVAQRIGKSVIRVVAGYRQAAREMHEIQSLTTTITHKTNTRPSTRFVKLC